MNTALLQNPQLHRATSMKAPATCGELVQASIDGQDFLVNCPIDLFSSATVRSHVVPGLHLDPTRKFSKIRDTVWLAAQELLLEVQHQVDVISKIPRGKGMASSTADVTAALAALFKNCGVSVPASMFARFLTEVEPSDCVHFPGIAHVNHLTGDLHEVLPAPENMRVLAVDCGGHVDTIGFDRVRARSVYQANRTAVLGMLGLLKRGLHAKRPDWVAQAATESARLSQQIHHKPQFETLLALARSEGALGVNCAHSGSILGVLYQSSTELKAALLSRIGREMGTDVTFVGDYKIINGGCFEN